MTDEMYSLDWYEPNFTGMLVSSVPLAPLSTVKSTETILRMGASWGAGGDGEVKPPFFAVCRLGDDRDAIVPVQGDGEVGRGGLDDPGAGGRELGERRHLGSNWDFSSTT